MVQNASTFKPLFLHLDVVACIWSKSQSWCITYYNSLCCKNKFHLNRHRQSRPRKTIQLFPPIPNLACYKFIGQQNKLPLRFLFYFLSYVHTLMCYKDLRETINPFYKPKISEESLLLLFHYFYNYKQQVIFFTPSFHWWGNYQ